MKGLIVLTILMGGVHVAAYGQTPSISAVTDLDRDMEGFHLESVEKKLAVMPAGPEKDYFAGLFANRCGRIEESVRLLEETIPKLGNARRDRAAMALETLADDYTKLYRYADAAKAYDGLLTHFAGELKKDKLDSTTDDYGVVKLLAEYTPQTISMSAPVHLATKGSPIGTIDTDLTVNGVTAPWILDTGASFSVVTASFAKRIGVQPSLGAAQTKGGVTGIENVLHVGLLPELNLGGATVHNVVLLILEDESLLLNLGLGKSYQIHAILGFPVFQMLGSATFTKHGTFEAGFHTAHSTSAARVFMNKLSPLIECSVEGRPLLLNFDTGAGESAFSIRYFEEFQEQFRGLKMVSSAVGGAGGTKNSDLYFLPEAKLRIAGKEVTLKKVRVFPFKAGTDVDDAYGNLGRDILMEFESFTLDFSHMTFSLDSHPAK